MAVQSTMLWQPSIYLSVYLSIYVIRSFRFGHLPLPQLICSLRKSPEPHTCLLNFTSHSVKLLCPNSRPANYVERTCLLQRIDDTFAHVTWTHDLSGLLLKAVALMSCITWPWVTAHPEPVVTLVGGLHPW